MNSVGRGWWRKEWEERINGEGKFMHRFAQARSSRGVRYAGWPAATFKGFLRSGTGTQAQAHRHRHTAHYLMAPCSEPRWGDRRELAT